MTQWDVVTWTFPHGQHPAVLISPPDLCAHGPYLNLLGCSSHRARRLPEVNEVLLDEADGLDWPSLCRVDILWVARRQEVTGRRGAVTRERRRELGAKIIRLFGFWQP